MLEKLFSQSGAESLGEITRLDSLLLHLGGMRGSEEYEFDGSGEMVKIRHYCFRCVDGDYTRQLVRELSCEAARVLLKLNEFGIGDWNGFKGPHPKNVSDGIMFRLEGNVNDGKRIHAEGSANFPKHFHEFTGWINKELQNAEEA